MTVGEFWEKVVLLCAVHRASVTSGFRTRARNALVGGASRSLHLLGLAADLVLDEDTPHARSALVIDAVRMGLHALDEDTHVHLQAFPSYRGGGEDSTS